MSSNAKGKTPATASGGGNKLPAVSKTPAAGGKPAATTPNKATPANAKATPNKAEKLPVITPTGKGASKANPVVEKTEGETVAATPAAEGASEAVQPTTGEQAVTAPTDPPVTSDATAPVPAEQPVVEAAPVVPVEPPKPVNNNGMVTLIYEQYNEQFQIVNGNTTHENIDDVYCLTFVMPNCKIHVSKYSPKEMREVQDTLAWEELYFREEPLGTYHGLEADQTYYVYAEQEADQLKRDQERMRKIASTMEGVAKKGDGLMPKDDGRAMESCSCIYGNPCVDEYGCKDWSNRFAIATKNGWKGF